MSSISEQRRCDSGDDNGGGKRGGEQFHEARPYGMSLISNEINMTTCYIHCKRFFENFRSIHFKLLICYWIMAGYLGDRARSVEDAYKLGFGILFDFVYKVKILKFSENDPGMIEFAGSSPNAANCCRHWGFCSLDMNDGDLVRIDFVQTIYKELGKIQKVVLSNDEMLSLNQPGSKFEDSARRSWIPLLPGWSNLLQQEEEDQERGKEANKYFATFNPTPDSLKALLQSVKNPSVLILRGVNDLAFALDSDSDSNSDSDSDWFIPTDRFRNLTVLEISGSTEMTTIPESTISELIHLECLNLSDLSIKALPTGLLKSFRSLRWLILRGCYKLLILDFSHFDVFALEVLDLSHCTSLVKLAGITGMKSYNHTNFREKAIKPWVLDLSYTPFDPFQLISSVYLAHRYHCSSHPSHLHLRGSKLEYLPSPELKPFLVQVLDLSGSSSLTKLDEGLSNDMPHLQKLDLSWTNVKHLPSFACLNRLHVLLLRGLELESFETLSSLPNQLKELDLTGLKISSSQDLKLDFLESLENLQSLNLSQTAVARLPDMSKLVRLRELLLANCQCLKVIPDLQALKKLEILDLSLPNDSSSHQLEIAAEGGMNSFLISTSMKKLVLTNRSGVQKLFQLTVLGNLNLEILDLRGTDVTDWESKLEAQQQTPQERTPKPFEIHIFSADGESSCDKSDQASTSKHIEKVFRMLISDIQKNLNFEMGQEQVEMLHRDLMYVQENYDRIKGSSNWKSGKKLIQELMDAATNLSEDGLALDSSEIKQLLRIVVKLKLLVPHKLTDVSEALEVTKQKKKTPLFKRSRSQENHVITVKGMQGMEQNLLSSYESLSTIQKNCLLCFSVFPYGEDRNKNTGVLKSTVIKKKILIYWWVGEGFIDPHHEGNGVPEPKTIEEIGKQILKVLADKGFIEPVMKKGRESGSCCIHPFVHCFVIERAKEEGFFDFDRKSGKLAPGFTRSHRACLLKPHHRVPSSCMLWEDYISSPNMLERFKTVRTLFNVNESLIDIKPEWFSKMNNLSVLHLGIWHSESTDLIEVSNQKFMVDLKKMARLRVLSFQGMPTIMKLPDSICYLSNLIILDLKECSYLEELPADIGSLKCLTHLDISSCPLLYRMPKGISLLLKLEVLKGFLITVKKVVQDNKQCGLFYRKNNEACTFKDLLKLERLRQLSIIVNIDTFPANQDLKVFKEMKSLSKLKILWKRNIYSDDITIASEQSKLTCWKRQQCQNHEEPGDGEEIDPLESIEKLELWCFPYETAPYWLNPRGLKSLKKLYTVGGNLRKFPGSGSDGSRWNVETLQLKYLHKLDIKWPELKSFFPKLMYLETVECGLHDFFLCNAEGVWRRPGR